MRGKVAAYHAGASSNHARPRCLAHLRLSLLSDFPQLLALWELRRLQREAHFQQQAQAAPSSAASLSGDH